MSGPIKVMTDLTTSVNTLIVTVKGQATKWNKAVTNEVNRLKAWNSDFLTKKEYLNDVAVIDNLITNPLFVVDGNDSVDRWGHSEGITIEVVSPYEKGFASPYIAEKRESQVTNKKDATKDNSYFAGTWSGFGGALNYSGALNGGLGLGNGWDVINGKIMKITFDGSMAGNKCLKFYLKKQFFGTQVNSKLSAFVFVESGKFFIGNHAGFQGAKNNSLECLPNDDWQYKETISRRNSGGSGGNGFSACFGFEHGTPSVVYLALPNYQVFSNAKNIFCANKD